LNLRGSGLHVGEPDVVALVVEEEPQALVGRETKVMAALRADPPVPFHLTGKQGLLALLALEEEALLDGGRGEALARAALSFLNHIWAADVNASAQNHRGAAAPSRA
jgi:hypothetical protein